MSPNQYGIDEKYLHSLYRMFLVLQFSHILLLSRQIFWPTSYVICHPQEYASVGARILKSTAAVGSLRIPRLCKKNEVKHKNKTILKITELNHVGFLFNGSV